MKRLLARLYGRRRPSTCTNESPASFETGDAGPSQVVEYHDVSTAALRVLDVFELLEMILIQLPIKDLLTHAQRVSRTWRATVKNSTRLQRALFISPVPSTPLELIDTTYGSLWVARESNLRPITVLENPYYWSILATITYGHHKAGLYAYAEASWRQMLVTQPPLSVLLYRLDSQSNMTTLLFSRPAPASILEKPEQQFIELRFRDIEEAARDASKCISAYVFGCRFWEKVEFGYEVDRATHY